MLVVGWRMLCRYAALTVALPSSLLADALPPLLVGWMICHLICVADLRTFGGVVSCSRFSCVVLARFVGPSVACCCSVLSFSFVFLLYFSVFSPLCSCVGQALFGRIKIVYVTAFFLMKNVLRHGCEKKYFLEFHFC